MKKLAIFMIVLPLISGCAHMQSRSIAYKESSASQMFVWRSDYSAGIGSEGKLCAQAATTARTAGASADLSANTALLAAFAPHLASMPQAEAAKFRTALEQSVMLTNSTNGQTAYANIAFFYLCQISMNAEDKLSAKDIVKMWGDVNGAAQNIGKENSGTANISSGAPAIQQGVGSTSPVILQGSTQQSVDSTPPGGQ